MTRMFQLTKIELVKLLNAIDPNNERAIEAIMLACADTPPKQVFNIKIEPQT